MIQLPTIFEDRMRQKLGAEFESFRDSLDKESPVSVRINPRKQNNIVKNAAVPWTDLGFFLPERPKFTFDPLFHAGTYYVQEASSMFLEQIFKQHLNNKNVNVLDLSAAPGGKSTHIISLISEESLLVSNEVIRSRAGILAENLLKWGYPNSIVTNNDPQDFQRLPGFFDVVVVDAPCSGEGLFRKDPDAVKEWSLENVNLCSSRQRRILADVWPTLKEDGVLIYSTCTYNESENEENLKWLKENHEVEPLRIEIDDRWGIVETVSDGIMGYRFFPHRSKGEGFFLAAIRKKSTTAGKTKMKKSLTYASRQTENALAPWLNHPHYFKFFQHQDYVFVFPEAKVESLEVIKENLKFVQAGTTLASTKYDKIIPEHGSAMSVYFNPQNFLSVEVDLQQAIRYLRRETFEWFDKAKGFQLIKYNGVPIGWINSLGNRFNNLYPIDWRIRSQNPDGPGAA